MPISIPDIDPRREVARRVFDAFVSQVPIFGGPAVAAWSVTHPSEAEQKCRGWAGDVANAINKMEEVVSALVPTVRLSEGAAALGFWLSQNSAQGRPEPIGFDRLVEAFPGATKRELQDACGELEMRGLAKTSAAIGHPVRIISPHVELFVVFDPSTIGSDPRRDAAELARRIITPESPPAAHQLLQDLKWDVRRFNPAMLLVAGYVAPGRKSGEIHPEFAVRYVMPDPAERAALKLFADSVLGE
ncbi:MAG: hypothetical protein IPL62_16380 [Caulobacteraceae bacterium]|nr:hypothetical protein [Caulobacteraceae bacterium]